MKNSPSYLEIESMLQQGQVLMTFAELREFLDMFAQKGLITPSEHEALLALAQKLDSDKSPRQ